MNSGYTTEHVALNDRSVLPPSLPDSHARAARGARGTRETRETTIAGLVLCVLAGIAPLSAAQSTQDNPLPARPLVLAPVELESDSPMVAISLLQMQELEQWTRDFAAWQAWFDQWFNRRQAGGWSYVAERKQKPDPPVWLEEVCLLLAADEPFVRGCAALEQWRQDPIAVKNRHAVAAGLTQREKPTTSTWWRHLHVDGLWSTTQSNVSAFGLFGAHATVEVAGRAQIFAAPGILLVSLPWLGGNRSLVPATDWGVTYRLFGVGRSVVHFNLVHAWILGNKTGLTSSSLTLAGFSVSFRPHPR